MPDYMTVGEVAKVFDVAADTVRWWERTGRLRALRTASGVRLFERRDVDALAHRRQAASQRQASRGVA